MSKHIMMTESELPVVSKLVNINFFPVLNGAQHLSAMQKCF